MNPFRIDGDLESAPPEFWETPIDIPEQRDFDTGYEIRHVLKEAGATLGTANARCRTFAGHQDRRIEFENPTRWHELCYKGGTWMSDFPDERVQMEIDARELHGSVLVGGLGLGLLPTILRREDNVEHVTVVEIEQAVVDLVWRHLRLPESFARVEVEDIFDHVKKDLSGYDCLYFDTWQLDNIETLLETVIPLRRRAVEAGFELCDIHFWNEDVMRGSAVFGLHGFAVWFTPDCPIELPSGLGDLDRFLSEGSGRVDIDWKIPYLKRVREGEAGADLMDCASYVRDLCNLQEDLWNGNEST